ELGVEIGFCDGIRSYDTSGIEIHPRNKNEFKHLLKKHRGDFDYIIVYGGGEGINRLAVKDERVDILTHPSLNYRDSGINSALAKEAEKNGVAVEVNLREIITAKRMDRVNAIRRIKTNLLLSKKYGFDLIVVSGAKSRYELRGSRQVYELLKLLGLDKEEIEDATHRVPTKILEDNKDRKDRNVIMKGVRVVG
ncbi:MAG: RNase P subunit p30 family protein, partial [Candidatus Hydrothermarchaeales archaeon]